MMELCKIPLLLAHAVAVCLLAGAAAPPNSELEHILLLAELASTPNEAQVALDLCEDAKSLFEPQGRFNLAWGILSIKNRDFEGAVEAFQKAKKISDTAVAARVAIGNLYITKRAISSATSDSLPRVDYVSFYEQVWTPEESWSALRRLIESPPESLPAWFWRNAGELALARQEFDVAEKAVGLAVRKEPVAHSLLLGRIQLARGDAADAIEAFRNALEREPTARGHLWLGRAYMLTGEQDAASEALERASALEPELAEAIVARADLDVLKGNSQEAINLLNGLLAKQPRIAEAYRSLGSAYMVLEDPATATSAYRRFRALAPADPRGPRLLGRSLQAKGELAEARRQLETALRRTPEDMTVLAQLVAIDIEQGRFEEASKRVRSRLDREGESATLHGLMGDVHQARGDLEAAEASYQAALRLSPDFQAIRIQLARAYAAAERWDDALGEIDKLLGSDPGNLSAHLVAAMVHQSQGNLDQAQKLYESALVIEPRNSVAANNLASILMLRGTDLDEARIYAEMAHEDAPNSPEIADTLGWVYYSLGRYENALPLIERAASKLTDTAEVQFHLGMVYYRLGRNEAARESLERALDLDSEFPGSEEARRTLVEMTQ